MDAVPHDLVLQLSALTTLLSSPVSVLGLQVCVPLPPWAMRAGARETIYYNPAEVTAAIVTCGGLCPGLNDVVQGLVRKLEDYGVPEGNILGIRWVCLHRAVRAASAVVSLQQAPGAAWRRQARGLAEGLAPGVYSAPCPTTATLTPFAWHRLEHRLTEQAAAQTRGRGTA